ncbi:NADH dehydrogenase [ubiquinone] 1 beta subcomplex subunit 9-like [Pecten maximus]|uniref:NADH dehydrogenase [ubiquinone] 1 beta subcomplex subunit 9-like n=1 Tax=Pecten maximus TaxID=6579 RepID=UPI001458A5FD|nr:NADH dehydrogenase [ubiquinone] 1 beta subcomplex subunit 9-like [Pecten maximus]
MSYMTTRAINHGQLVKTLYKQALRAHETTTNYRLDYRFGAVRIRAMFEKYRNERDMDKVNQLMAYTEKMIFLTIPKTKQFEHCPRGIAHGRYDVSPDMVFDAYHPLEKAAYPKYFAKRELAKRDHILWWEKTYGNTEAKSN